jgi:hypothetical protein
MYRDPMNSAFDMYRMMAAAAEAFTKYSWADAAGADSMPVDAAKRMSQLYMAFMNSGYRYLARWAEISVKRYPEFAMLSAGMNANRTITEDEMAALVDSLRAYLREMADLPLEESKRLQAEIDAIMTSKASDTANAGGTGSSEAQRPRKRRARAKR